MEICIFEDDQLHLLNPMTYSRPVFELMCGINTLREKIERFFPGIEVSLHTRPELAVICKQVNPGLSVNTVSTDACLFINGRVLADKNFIDIIQAEKDNTVFINGRSVAAAFLRGSKLLAFKDRLLSAISLQSFGDCKSVSVDCTLLNYAWDLIRYNPQELLKDTEYFVLNHLTNHESSIKGIIYDGVHLIERDNIFIAEGARVKPGTVIDASGGPVVVDKNAHIFPNCVIEGPVYIGESAQVKSFAWIYDNTSIGKVCKVGGEVECSIIHSYSNKQHSGFLGHSILGSWVNLGADTNSSDLKNNYSTVRVALNGQEIDTGLQFLGLIMGDHSKSAINTMFNTGTVVGFSSNIYGGGFPPKFIPSFSWGGSEGIETYLPEKAIETARRVLGRRSLVMSECEARLFYYIFETMNSEQL